VENENFRGDFMQTRLEHFLIGALAGLGIYGLYKRLKEETPTLQGALGSMVVGGLVGLAPDVIEPATNPNHRSFFHSAVLLFLLGYGNLKAWQSSQLSEDQKLFVLILSAAYGSHLISDSTTKKGLPLLI